MALVYGKDQGYDTDPEQVFDAADNEVADVGLVEGITENLFYKIINQAPMFEKTREKIKNNKDPEYRASAHLNVKDVIASLIAIAKSSSLSLSVTASLGRLPRDSGIPIKVGGRSTPP